MTSDFKQIMDICDYKESKLSSLNGKVTLHERVNEVYKIFDGLRKPGNRSIGNIAMNQNVEQQGLTCQSSHLASAFLNHTCII